MEGTLPFYRYFPSGQRLNTFLFRQFYPDIVTWYLFIYQLNDDDADMCVCNSEFNERLKITQTAIRRAENIETYGSL